jgi:hypothetical protein
MPEKYENQGSSKRIQYLRMRSCFALMSTFVGHGEEPDEATLVEQHTGQLLDSREVGSNRNSI